MNTDLHRRSCECFYCAVNQRDRYKAALTLILDVGDRQATEIARKALAQPEMKASTEEQWPTKPIKLPPPDPAGSVPFVEG